MKLFSHLPLQLLKSAVIGTAVGIEHARQLQDFTDIKIKSSLTNDAFLYNSARSNLGLNHGDSHNKYYIYTANIVTQAFRDLGFTKPVNVLIYQGTKFHAGVGVSRIDGNKAANVFISLPHEHRPSRETIYAVAGHEAVHAMRDHALMQPFTTTFLMTACAELIMYMQMKISLTDRIACKGILIATLCSLIYTKFDMALSRTIERDADITSIRKLHTSQALAEFFIKLLHNKQQYYERNNIPMPAPTTHPDEKDRIAYINFFSTGKQQKLFEGDRIKKINKKTEEQFQRCSIEHQRPR